MDSVGFISTSVPTYLFGEEGQSAVILVRRSLGLCGKARNRWRDGRAGKGRGASVGRGRPYRMSLLEMRDMTELQWKVFVSVG